MNKKIIFLILLAVVALPLVVSADACGGTGGGNDQLGKIATNVSNAAMAVGAALAIVGFVIAGIIYLTSAGSPEKTKTAKSALVAAVIGSALIALAQGGKIMTDIICKMITT